MGAGAIRRQRLPAAGQPGRTTDRERRTRGPGGDLLCAAAPDGARCGALHGQVAAYERIAKDERIPHCAFNAGQRTKRPPRSQHIKTVNALIDWFRACMQPFCGPASEPCRLRPLACRPEQHGPLLPRCAQAHARFSTSCLHDLLTRPWLSYDRLPLIFA